jgi:predicted esterase
MKYTTRCLSKSIQRPASVTIEEYGKSFLVTLPYNEETIDSEHKVSKLKRLFYNYEYAQREYVLYIPNSLISIENEIRYVPVVFCFHGTDETHMDTQLYIQEANNEKSWLYLADKEQFIVIFGQSRGIETIIEEEPKPHHRIQYEWQPGTEDVVYIDHVLEHVDTFLNEKRYCIRMDHDNLFAIGFSNGGLFMSDYVMSECTVKMKNLKFKAVCNYMGGTDLFEPELEELKQQRVSETVTTSQLPPILIVTGTYDENVGPCLRAEKLYKDVYQFPQVQCIILEDQKHEYISESTSVIFNFFKENMELKSNNPDTKSSTNWFTLVYNPLTTISSMVTCWNY